MTIRAEEEEETKLHVAVRLHNLKLVRAALRDEGLDVDALGTYGWTSLHDAASCGYLDIVILLLDNGADPNIQDSLQKCTPLHLAARNGHLEVVRSLVRGGARLDLRNAEGKIPQNYADDECREFLKKQRIEDVIKLSPSPVEDSRSLNKLYGQRSSQSPVLKTVRQSSPQWSESSHSSRDSMSSSSSGSSESFCASSTALHQPGPGEIKVALDFNRERHTLIVRLEEIRDVKLPADHNMSHIYVKCYIVPDQRKATKRKTSLFTLVRNDGGRSSSDSVTSWSSEENDCGKRSEKRVGQRFVSSMKRGTRLSSKKKRDQDQATSMQESMIPIYRISTSLGETFRYDSVHLRKVNFDTANVMLMVCGRNRMTTQSQPIACLTVPLTCCGKVSAPQWFPLVYRIMLPSGHDVEIHQPLSLTKSWDQQGGKSTRRTSAWNEPTMSMSMPNIDFATASAATSQTFPRTSQGGEGSFPLDGSKRYKKHSGASKMFRREFKLMKGKGNNRYKNSAARQESENRVTQEENVVDSLCNDDVEVLSPLTLLPRPDHASDLNRTLREQNRDIANKLRDLPNNRMHDSGRSNLENSLRGKAPEVVDLVEEPSTRPELEHRSSFAGSLKYSRAFQQKNSTSHRRDVVLHDVECEDVEEITDAPFAVTNVYGCKSGIACN